jgi:HSP20 family protein
MNDMTHYRKFIPVSIQSGKPSPLSIQQEMERVMNYFNREFGFLTFPAERFEDLALHPSIDIIDDKDHFKIEVEMPGMGEADIKIAISDGLLTIKGEKETSKKDEGKNYLMREIHYGRYERTVALPDSVDISQAKASFKKGMLWVDIPKRSEVVKQSREIKVDKVE